VKKANNIILLFLACIFVVFMSTIPFYIKKVTVSNINSKPVLIVDAGHGGFDGGAIAIDGTFEKEINLSISKKISSIAQLSGFEVIMVRQDDIAVCEDGLDTIRAKKVSDIHNRFELAKKYPEAIYLSIHQNSFGEEKYWGTQVFYGPNNPESKKIAQHIQGTISQSLQNDNHREIKKAEKNLYILYNTNNAAVMVECGFLSNREECKLLQQPDYQQKLAFEITKSLIEYVFLPDKI